MKKRTLSILLLLAMLVSAAAVPAAAESPAENEREMYTFLTETLELNRAAACGIIANSYYETGCRADLGVGTYYGLFMYYAPLAASLRSWCQEHDFEYQKVSGQMAFLQAMFEGEVSGFDYRALYADLKEVPNTAAGAYFAAEEFCRRFERPANPDFESNRRGIHASSTLFARYEDFRPEDTVENPEPQQQPQSEPEPQQSTSGGDTAEPAGVRKVIALIGLNVRSKPGTSSGILSALPYGASVKVTDETQTVGGALWIRLCSGGWVCATYLSGGEDEAEPEEPKQEEPAEEPKEEPQEEPKEEPKEEPASEREEELEPTEYVVDASALNVRRDAGMGFAVRFCVYRGQRVTVDAQKHDPEGGLWYRLKESGGWVSSLYLAIPQGKKAEEPETIGETVFTVTADALNVRSGAGMGCGVIGMLWRGQKVTLTERSSDANGRSWGKRAGGGWVCMDYVTQ